MLCSRSRHLAALLYTFTIMSSLPYSSWPAAKEKYKQPKKNTRILTLLHEKEEKEVRKTQDEEAYESHFDPEPC